MKSLKSRRTLFFTLLFLVAFCYCGVLYFLSYKTLAIVFFCITAVMGLIYLYLYRQLVNHSVSLISGLVGFLSIEDRKSLDELNVPAVLLNDERVPVWFNEKFRFEVAGDCEDIEKGIYNYYPEDVSSLYSNEGLKHYCDNKVFSIYSSKVIGKKVNGTLLIYFDVTQLQNDSDELKRIRPSLLIGFYDNLDEMFQDYSESEFDEIKVGVDRIVDAWLKQYGCISRKIGSDRFIAVVHEENLNRMIENKFDIVEKVKENKFGGAFGGVSLSIGIGKGKDLVECEKSARQSLDMALSRGGDQVAIKDGENYEFFGGLSVGKYKTDKVRSRVVAGGIAQLFNLCDDVYIVGHKFSDMDSVGAAVGIAAAVKQFKKNAYIVCNRETSLSNKLIDHIILQSGKNIFTDFKKAEAKINGNSVLVVVDTHRRERLEFPELLDKTDNIVIIDHHRKAVDFISNAVVFHHDPNASSTCEMTAEILPYLLNDNKLTSYEAEAMTAGIMLDTKNFVLRTGVRTFEAAAYLRRFNPDLVLVKELFSSSADNYKIKNKIISDAEIYKKTAISVSDFKGEDIRVITSQAADELLNIESVLASFVLFSTDAGICISARSLGAVNVQLIMEKLGGGDHLTMAAAQLKDKDPQSAVEMLKKEIDDYSDNFNLLKNCYVHLPVKITQKYSQYYYYN